jgi:dimethylaniline monooxygenase (N-oxide forming)
MTKPMQDAPRTDRGAKGRRYAVIGAGASGLCAAKHLLASGFEDVTIFEIGSRIGGLWCYENDNRRSPAYRTLHINTARNLTQFEDYPFPADVQPFPSHEDMYRYLVAYAERFDLVRRIRFRSRVERLEPAPDHDRTDPRWLLRLADGSVESFDRVIVASGHLSVPLHVPDYRDRFTGEYLHSVDYREPDRFVGKKTCVIGVGNSACDIASDLCVTSPGTVLVARSGVMIGPKLIFGYPFTDVTMKLYRRWIPDRLRRRIIAALVRLIHGRMTDLGFKPLTERAHPTTNAVIVQHIAYRRITVKQGIERIDGRRIHFVDGTSGDFDALIACTGYLIDLPFVPESIVPVHDNTVALYKRTCPPGWDGLYFMGMFNTTTALNLIFERQAKWICAHETGAAVLPDADAMRADIAAKQAWIARHYKPSLRHGIEEEHLFFLQELDRSEREGRRRARRTRRTPVAAFADDAPKATA